MKCWKVRRIFLAGKELERVNAENFIKSNTKIESKVAENVDLTKSTKVFDKFPNIFKENVWWEELVKVYQSNYLIYYILIN